MKIIELLPPLLFVLLILIFFSGMPDLKSCPLEAKKTRSGKKATAGFGRFINLPLLLVTVIYAVTAFVNLGNTRSPETFLPMSGSTVTLELTGEAEIDKIALFAGVGSGGYNIEYSTDGENYSPLTEFKSDHAAVLKWHYIEAKAEAKSLRISCTYGSPYLGELVLLDESGAPLPYVTAYAALCDEQDTLPESMSYLNSSYFDEVYHPRTAWEHLNDVWPYEISHPPLGKLIIALGVSIFGMTPFGWRFSGTLIGCLMLPVMYAFIKRLFKSDKVALLGTIVFAADFMHFTQTRIATIDSYAVFFILLMYYYMYIFVSEDDWKALALSGVFFGMGAASKWTCLYAGAGLAVIWLLYWIYKCHSERHSPCHSERSEESLSLLIKNIPFCILFFVLIPALIYYLSYFPYGRAEGCLPFSGEYTKIVLDNQKFMFTYHSGVTAEHPYSSRWYQWVLNIRPILYYLEYMDGGLRRSIAAFLSPVTCWGGLLCLFVLVYTGIFRRDKKALFILLGYLAQLVPWMFVKRLTFEYHYFPCSVFLVLAIAYVFNIYRLGKKDWLAWCATAAGVSVLLFMLFFPALSGLTVHNAQASRIMGWLPTWPI